ncbi:ABC transporter substrate-binding protein [Streptomyces sp. M19]
MPDAARSCGFTDDTLLRYRCELRSGLRFSGGREITSDDVKYSFDRIRAIDDAQGPTPLLDSLKEVATDGPRTVVFSLSSPDATFPFKIATGAGSIVDREVYPATELREGDEATGSGPYVLKSFAKGTGPSCAPTPTTAAPPRRRADRSASATTATRLAWTGRGRDTTWTSPGAACRPRRSRPWTPPTTTRTSASPPVPPPGTWCSTPGRLRRPRRGGAARGSRRPGPRGARPRRALPYRRSAVLADTEGHHRPHHGVLRRLSGTRRAGLPQAAGGRGRAHPVRLTLGYAKDETAQAEAENVEKQLERTDLFQVTTEGPKWAEFQHDFVDGDYDMFLVGWVADFPDPDNFIAPLIGSRAGWYNGYKSDRVDELIRATQREPERSRAVEDFRAIERLAAQDVPVLPLYQQKVQVLSVGSIQGTQYLSDGTGDWRLWELERI